jgi:hypothetical protein
MLVVFVFYKLNFVHSIILNFSILHFFLLINFIFHSIFCLILIKANFLLKDEISLLFLLHDLCVFLWIKFISTMYNALWTYTFTFACETKIQNVLINMLSTCLFCWYSSHQLIAYVWRRYLSWVIRSKLWILKSEFWWLCWFAYCSLWSGRGNEFL